MWCPKGERGAGSVLAVAVLAVVTVFAVALAVASVVAVEGRRAQAAADLAALAAADTASGLVPGIPCDTALRVARANDAALQACALEGQVALVTVEAGARWPVRSTARAGPPGSP
ncbi:MAG TPA: Rv3654c family TadE-like protein [Microbacteriaceae bacterium]|nr:Rv3654c family TadE-like protein [Microbacteriaceae bacterium]